MAVIPDNDPGRNDKKLTFYGFINLEPLNPERSPEFYLISHTSYKFSKKENSIFSVKRLSVIIGIIWGRIIFKETNILTRRVGTVLMVGGAVLITICRR